MSFANAIDIRPRCAIGRPKNVRENGPSQRKTLITLLQSEGFGRYTRSRFGHCSIPTVSTGRIGERQIGHDAWIDPKTEEAYSAQPVQSIPIEFPQFFDFSSNPSVRTRTRGPSCTVSLYRLRMGRLKTHGRLSSTP